MFLVSMMYPNNNGEAGEESVQYEDIYGEYVFLVWIVLCFSYPFVNSRIPGKNKHVAKLVLAVISTIIISKYLSKHWR